MSDPFSPLTDAIKGAGKLVAESREQAITEQMTELVKDEKAKKIIEVAAQKALNSEAYREIRKAARALLPFVKELPKRDAALLFSIDNLATITFDEAQSAWKLLRKHAAFLKEIDVNAISAPKKIDATGTEKTIVTPLPLPEPRAPLGAWNALDDFERRYIWFPEDASYLLLKLWIAHTYVKDQLTDDYHLLPAGKTESGKNQVLHAIFLTSASGYAASSMKPAGLFRSVEANPTMTLILEEFTVPYNPDEDAKDIVELLLSMIFFDFSSLTSSVTSRCITRSRSVVALCARYSSSETIRPPPDRRRRCTGRPSRSRD